MCVIERSRNISIILERHFLLQIYAYYLCCDLRGCARSCVHVFTDACRHHPGVPYFHDAYKGWTCCNKKSVDFTEFLNIKGCQLAKHSNEKPPEPEKPAPKIVDEAEEPEKIPEPLKPSALERPPFDTELTTLQPTVPPALKQSIDKLSESDAKKQTTVNSTYETHVEINASTMIMVSSLFAVMCWSERHAKMAVAVKNMNRQPAMAPNAVTIRARRSFTKV